MANPRLVSVHAKIDRARHHVDELNDAAQSWFEAQPEAKALIEIDGEWEVIRLQLPQSLPTLFAVIAGDAIHNLRSALDHLVWQLVDAISGKPSRDSYYPVLTNEKDFENRVWKPRTDRRGREQGPLIGIPLDHPVLKVIESQQPYRRVEADEPAEAHPLAVLNRMWNIDKHRTLHVRRLASLYPERVLECLHWHPSVALLDWRMNTAQPLAGAREDNEFARFRFAPSDRPKPHVYAEGDFPVTVMLGYTVKRPGISVLMPSSEGLIQLFDEVLRVVAELEGFMEGPDVK